MSTIRAGIIGGSGYTGAELLRLLAAHPQVRVAWVTSRGEAGRAVSELFPSLRGHADLDFIDPAQADSGAVDVVFYATPHATAMHTVAETLAAGVRVVDLSADFRLRDQAQWEAAYGCAHAAPELLAEAVYGLPEVNRAAIAGARLVAVPGCYPTTVQLSLAPLLAAGLCDPDSIIADCKSGVSGAGRNAKIGALLCEAGENFAAYGSAGHRHEPEIAQGLSAIAGTAVTPIFIPHLVPMIRGIHASCYVRLTAEADLQALYEQHYRDEPFVDVMPGGSHPETRSVRGSNMCRIAVSRRGGTAIVFGVTDNLVKGAAGQAVQCMNLMLGCAEDAGLGGIALLP